MSAPVALHHVVDGPDGAPVPELSGSHGSAHEMWEPQVPALARHFRVVRYDLRGHGRSPVPPGPYDIADLGADLVALLDRLGVARAHLCGLSLGGMLSLWTAAHHPERVERLVVCCTSALLGPAELWVERATIVAARGTAAVADGVLSRWFTPALHARDPALVARMRAMLAATPAAGYAACCGAIQRMDLRADLAAIRAPTLAIAGAEDPSTPPAHLSRIASAIAGCRLAVVDDAAHLANVEQPERVALILEHLRGHAIPDSTKGDTVSDSQRDIGMRLRRQVLGDAHVDRAVAATTPFTAAFQDFITRVAWGDVWARGSRPAHALVRDAGDPDRARAQRRSRCTRAALQQGHAVRSGPGTTAFAMRQPVGVVLSIAPWNAPIILGVRAVAMPLACGNTVVFKASENCPRTHALIVEAFGEAGLPPGALNLVTNAPEDAGKIVEALIAHQKVRRVNFTGSTRVGRIIAETAARYLKPALLELGGKAPLIVLDDADIDEAVNAAVFGAFANQGQICMSTEKIVLDNRIAELFLAKFAARASALPAGDPRGHVVLGACVSVEAVRRVGELIRDATAKGAKILAGGASDGPIMQATILDQVTPAMRIYEEESFGPVVPRCWSRATARPKRSGSPTTPNTASPPPSTPRTSRAASGSRARSNRGSATSRRVARRPPPNPPDGERDHQLEAHLRNGRSRRA